jgi:hypothetical protein
MTDNQTGSTLERGTHCPAWAALHKAGRTGEAAIKGTSNHSEIEGGINKGEVSSREVVRQACEGARLVNSEASYAIDVEKETARYIGGGLNRKYGPLSVSEIALTIDLVAWRLDGVWVWDWKSRKRVTPASSNLQLRAAAVALLKVEGVSMVHGGIGYLDNDEADVHTFDAFDLPGFFNDMRSMLNRIGAARALVATGGTPDVHAGPWCDYCPSMPYCPAHTRLAMSMMGELDTISKEIAFFTPEQVSKAWDIKKRLETMLESVDESLKLRIQQGVIPRPNNKRLMMVECRKQVDDNAKIRARLAELGEDLSKYKRTIFYDQVKEVNGGK